MTDDVLLTRTGDTLTFSHMTPPSKLKPLYPSAPPPCVCSPQGPHLLQRCGLVSRDEPAHDDVLEQDYLEGGQNGAAVEHWGREAGVSIQSMGGRDN